MLLFFPSLNSKQLLFKHQSIEFFVWTDIKDINKIELWSNIHENKVWNAKPFISSSLQWYSLTLLPNQFKPDKYEFTLRYYQDNKEIWHGSPGNNGILYIVPYLSSLPSLTLLSSPTINNTLQLVHQDKDNESHLKSSIYKINTIPGQHCIPYYRISPLYSYMALVRKSSHWLVPVSGYDQIENDNRPWQLFMYRDRSNGIIYIWIVITCDGKDGWLNVNTHNSTLELHTKMDDHHYYNNDQHEQSLYLLNGVLNDDKTESIDYLITTMINNYYYLTKTKTNTSSSSSPSTLSLTPSSSPPPIASSSSYLINVFNDYLGYCSWSSFGKNNLNYQQIDHALQSLENDDIPIRYLILDDGWQSEEDGYLLDFDTNQDKFLGGLKQTIHRLKRSHPSLLNIGIWHTIWGYWKGMDPSKYSHLYQGIKSFKTQKEDGGEQYSIQLVNNIQKFYDDFYRFLKKSGVGMVKIDNQGGFDSLKGISLQQKHKLWSDYLDAVDHALQKHSIHLSIHCMAVNPHLLDLQIRKNNKCHNTILRNSDDYFPDEFNSHTWHVYTNILNSLWTSQIYNTLDFDMFQSNHPFAFYHATSRAISGGPIYISDKPGIHDANLLKKLMAKNKKGDNQLLRCKQPCFPLFNTIFNGNPVMNHHNVIAAWNKHGRYRIIGFWNMSVDQYAISTVIIPKYYIGYVTFGLDQGSWIWNDSDNNNNNNNNNSLPLRVENHGSSLITLSPVYSLNNHHSLMKGGISCLGLLDKFNGNEAIISTEIITNHQQQNRNELLFFKVKLSHQSEKCGFFFSSVNTIIKNVTLDGSPIKITALNESIPANIWIVDLTDHLLKKSSPSLNSHFEITLDIQLLDN